MGDLSERLFELFDTTPRLVTLSDVEPEEVEWLWPGRIPLGKLTVLDGNPGLGKSTLTLDLAARLTTGRPMPLEDCCSFPPRDVVVMSAEDGIADTIVPRLLAAGADLTRVHVLTGVPAPFGGLRPIALPDDLDTLRQAVESTSAGLVVIDPLMNHIGRGSDTHKDQDVRAMLAPVGMLAEKSGAAILITRHLNKASGGPSMYRGGGSIGIIGIVRSALMVGDDPKDPTQRVLASTKSNLAARSLSLAYRMVTDDEHGAPRIEWLGIANYTADQLVADPSARVSKVDEAVDFIREFLADGPLPAVQVEDAAKAAGISPATLRRARGIAGVRPAKQGFGRDGGWLWSLTASIDDVEEPGLSEMSAYGSESTFGGEA